MKKIIQNSLSVLFFLLAPFNVNSQEKKGEEELLETISPKEYKFKSLMFSTKELDDINEAVNSFKSGIKLTIEDEKKSGLSQSELETLEREQKQKELLELNERSKIYLGSILYISKENWTIWLGGQKITSNNNKKSNEFYVEEIDGQKVKILWTLSVSKWKILSSKSDQDIKINSKSQVFVNFTLRPNQTYILKYDSVVEGKQKTTQLENEIKEE